MWEKCWYVGGTDDGMMVSDRPAALPCAAACGCGDVEIAVALDLVFVV
jgi:hypothetical protein